MIRWLLKQHFVREAWVVLQSTADPEAAQRATFRRLHRLLRDTKVGRQSGFARCRELEDCRALPVSSANTLKPWLDEILRRGDSARSLFGSSRVKGFVRTSGTVESKTLPLNASYYESYSR